MARRTIVWAVVLVATLPGTSSGQGRGAGKGRERQGTTLPKRSDLAGLVPGTSRYAGTLWGRGQTNAVELVIEIRDLGSAWNVNETWTIGPGPPMVQTSELEKGTLNVLRYSFRNAGFRIEYEVRDGRATGREGTVAFGPFKASWAPISIDVGGPVFADGAGAPQVVASLALAQGYSTQFSNLEIHLKRPVVRKTLTVVGRERIDVPAGSFLAWRAEVGSDRPGVHTMTVWVEVESRRVLRVDTPSVPPASASSIFLQDPMPDQSRR